MIVVSCCSAQENHKDYYYPIGANQEVKVYKYIDKNNSDNIEYWKVTTNPKMNTILTESFTTDFRLYNIFEEQLNENGAEVIKYADFVKINDSVDIRVNGVIIDKDVYKWSDEMKFRYSVKYKIPKFATKYSLKRELKIVLRK